MIEFGYELPFSCPRREVPRFAARRNKEGCDLYQHWLKPAIREMVAVGAVREVHEAPWIVASVDVVPKSVEGKYRLIVDLRCLNDYILRRGFKYESLGSFRHAIERDDFFFSFDLESGYFHVDVAQQDQTFLGFKLFGKFYVFCVLPFGLRDACYIFTRIMSVPVKALRARGFRIMAYLDDFLFALREHRPDLVDEARCLFESLGFRLNMEKSIFELVRRIGSLGITVDSASFTFELTPRRLEKFGRVADELFDAAKLGAPVAARLVARVVGHISSASLVFGRRATLLSCFLKDSIVDVARSRRWRSLVRLNADALDELKQWRSLLLTPQVVPIQKQQRRRTTVLVASDASDFAWGGRLLRFDARPSLEHDPARGVFDEDHRTWSSAWRELAGVRGVLEAFIGPLESQVVDFQVDAQAAERIHFKGASLRRGPDGSLYLHNLVLDIESLCRTAHIDLRLIWVPRELNQLADDDSKVVDVWNYGLCSSEFRRLDNRFGPHTVDRFADVENAHLPVFNSRWVCRCSSGVDAMTFDWGSDINWLHPPKVMIAAVVSKLRFDQGRGTLIAPWRPSAFWWAILFPVDVRSPVISKSPIVSSRGVIVAFEPKSAEGLHGAAPSEHLWAFQLDFSL